MEITVNTSSCSNRQGGEQANYFYVVWPEETVSSLGAAGRLDSALCAAAGGLQNKPLAAAPLHRPLVQSLQGSDFPVLHHCPPQQHQMSVDRSPIAPRLQSPPIEKPLPDIDVCSGAGGGGFASPLTSPILSIADTSPLMTDPRGSPGALACRDAEESNQTTSTGSDIFTGVRDRDVLPPRMLSHPPSHPTPSIAISPGVQTLSLKTSGFNSLPTNTPTAHNGESTMRENLSKICNKVSSAQTNGAHFNDTTSTLGSHQIDHDSISGNRRKRSRFLYLNGCLECEVKDAEIKTLRRRIQVMEEVVNFMNHKLSSVQQQGGNSLLFGQMMMPPVVSQVVVPPSYTTPPTTSAKVHTSGTSAETNHCANATSSDSDDTSSDSASIAYAQAELCPSAEQKVELLPGTGVYVTLPQLEEARRESKNGTQLARKLMDAFWDRDTLARSSLSSKSKYQYQQLDPNVISTIEAYCLNFDGNTHSRDLHACMTDKCCQARSRRGAPYKTLQNGLLMQNGVVHNGLNGT